MSTTRRFQEPVQGRLRSRKCDRPEKYTYAPDPHLRKTKRAVAVCAPNSFEHSLGPVCLSLPASNARQAFSCRVLRPTRIRTRVGIAKASCRSGSLECYAGLVTSQNRVTAGLRSHTEPPSGKLEPSGSPWISCLPLNSEACCLPKSADRKLSLAFSAVPPVSGLKRCARSGWLPFSAPNPSSRRDNVRKR